MADQKTTEAFVIRNFRDAGTEQEFTADTILEIADGAFANYAAAGLVRKATAEDRTAVAG